MPVYYSISQTDAGTSADCVDHGKQESALSDSRDQLEMDFCRNTC